MVALVHVPARLGGERVDGVELDRLDACVLQALEKRLRCGEAADAVVDQVDLDTLSLLCDQGVGEFPPGLVALEDVGLHVDVVACRGDRREHRRIGVRPVFEQRDPVAQAERAARDFLLEGQVAGERVRVVRPGESGQDLAAALG